MKLPRYFDVKDKDRSGLEAQIGAQRQRVAERLATVGHVVLVMSGKGGVGKSYLTAGLARGLAPRVRGVGVLDADLRSPTVARLLGAAGPLAVSGDAIEPAAGAEGVKVMSADFLIAEGRPLAWHEPQNERFVWRGTLEVGALREFLSDVAWGDLDLLLIDLPPGADGVVEVGALVPNLTGAIAVTIPSEESRRSVSRAMRAASEAGIRLLGVVENMSGYRCPQCEAIHPLFGGDAGPRLAEEFQAPLLGRVPFTAAGQLPLEPLVDAFLQVLS